MSVLFVSLKFYLFTILRYEDLTHIHYGTDRISIYYSYSITNNSYL